MQNQDQILNQIVQIIKKELNPSKIYLFGSRARGDHTVQSDYDFVVVVDELKESKNTLIQKTQMALFDIIISIDIILYTKAEFLELSQEFGTIPETVLEEGMECSLGG